MTKKIYFDLDGTVYDLYSIKSWLNKLQAEKEEVFLEGKFLGNYEDFMESISELISYGYNFGVITWLPMQASPEYEEICRQEKIKWINKYLPFVSEINICSYGIPKQNCIQKRAKLMYLIDDNIEVCKMWETPLQRKAINIDSEFTVINALNEIIENE